MPEFIVCANAGDARALLQLVDTEIRMLSIDHKPDQVAETTRIEVT